MSITTLGQEPTYTHQGQDWNKNTTTEVYQTEADPYTTIIIADGEGRKEVKYRNVGPINEQSTIQFTVEEYTYATNRRKSVSFSIPLELCAPFINGLIYKKK